VANTGGGGGGSFASGAGGTAGGSGVVILRLPPGRTLTAGVGLTMSASTAGSDNIYTFTAGTGTVTVA
jgi:hypothetical protein